MIEMIEMIKGNDVYVKDGPSAEIPVGTLGVPELDGIETGVGH